MKNNKFILTLFLTLLLPFSAIFAKGFSSSGSRSSSSFSSRSSSSSSKPSGFSSSGSKPSSSNSYSSSSKPKSSFDYAQQRASLPKPKPKSEYVSDFKAKNANKYPTTFDTKPATRPSYIPPVTTYNGQPRNIEYNPATRSYGFFDDLGKFMIYDAITDLALKSFDNDEKIYVQKINNLNAQETAELQQQQKSSNCFLKVILWILIIFFFIVLLISFLKV